MAVAAEPARPVRAAVPKAATGTLRTRAFRFLPRGNLLDEAVWRRRHAILQLFLLLHLPALILFGLWMKHPPLDVLGLTAPIVLFRLLGALPGSRRVVSFFTTAGILYCSVVLVILANGATEAHFHFFVVIGFIALYQDWVPFLWEITFTVLSHGIISALKPDLMFNTMAGMDHPWRISFVHGFAVLAACVGIVLFWRTTEDEQQKALELTRRLGEAEAGRRQFTSDLLVSLARRNQSMLYRQLDIIGQLENSEQDADVLADLFRLDHLATRIRRNAENLLVLSGEEPPRVWGKPVGLTDVVRASIAETEDLSRVGFVIDPRLALIGHAVIDVTHLLAELIENAVRSSPPQTRVTVRTTPDVRSPGSILLTVEDWGVGMPADELAAANQVLSAPRDVDALVSGRLGLHVVARLAQRYRIQVILTSTSGTGITAVIQLPPDLFTAGDVPVAELTAGPVTAPISGPIGGPAAGPVTGPAAKPLAGPGFLPPTPTDHRQGYSPVQHNGAPSSVVPDPPDRPDPRDRPTGRPTSRPTDPSSDRFADQFPAPGNDAPAIRLARRTPQSHLAPELQRGNQARASVGPPARLAPTVPNGPPGVEAARARDALSRYQASRQAALAANESPERNRS
jgi:signal transduction histidine kinase